MVLGNSDRTGKIAVECLNDVPISKVTSKFKWTEQNRKDHFGPKFGQKLFFEVSALLAVSHCPRLQSWAILGKTNGGTLRKWQKNPNFGSNLGPFSPKLGSKYFCSWILPMLYVRHCCKLSLHAISRKINEPNLRKWQKKN